MVVIPECKSGDRDDWEDFSWATADGSSTWGWRRELFLSEGQPQEEYDHKLISTCQPVKEEEVNVAIKSLLTSEKCAPY